MKVYRQGDVIFHEVTGITTINSSLMDTPSQEDLVERDLVLQHGEHGGKHKVAKRDRSKVSLVTEGKKRTLVVRAPVEIVHKEHGTVVLPKGIYDVVIQREMGKVKERQVKD